MPEGVADLEPVSVVPAIADEQPLAVPDGAELAGEGPDRRIVRVAHGHGLGEAARGVDRAEEQIGDGAPAALAEQPTLEDGAGAVLPGVQRHDRAVGKHDDDLVVDGRHGLEQVELCGGKVQMRPVVALGLVRGRQAEEHHHHLGGPGLLDRLRPQVGVALRRLGHESWGERDLARRADGVPDRREGVVEAGRHHLGAAGALVAGSAGELTDDGDRPAAAGVEGEDRPVVLQQHRARRRDLAGQRVVGVGVEGLAGCKCWQCPVDQRQDAGDGEVDVGQGEGARGNGREDLALTTAARRRHLEVEPGMHRRGPIVHGAPVGDDDAVVSPVPTQHVGQEPAVLRGVHAVDPVVGAHHGPRPRGGDDPFEGGQVDLPQRPLVDLGRHGHPVRLLVVRGEVFERGTHAPALDAAHERRAELAGEQRVLGEVLEVAPAQRRALHVHSGAEQHRDLLRPALVTQRDADAGEEVDVPGRGEPGRRGKARGGNGRADAEMVARGRLLAQPVRSVGDHDGRDAEPRDGFGVPEVGAVQQSGLLLERERVEQRGDVEPGRGVGCHGHDGHATAKPTVR